jgi:hypothetical protein
LKVTDLTKRVLHYRRIVKEWRKEGYEQVGERGGNLWQLYRGARVGKKIVDVRIAPDGLSVFVKIA